MSNIDRIRQSKLSRRFEEDIPNPLNDRVLFSLTYIQNLQESPVAFSKVEDVSKDIVDEVVELVLWYDGGIGHSQRLDEDRVDDVEVLQILLFFTDKLVNNPGKQ